MLTYSIAVALRFGNSSSHECKKKRDAATAQYANFGAISKFRLKLKPFS